MCTRMCPLLCNLKNENYEGPMSLNINTNQFDNEPKQEVKKKPEEEEPAPLLFVDVNLGDEE